MISVTRKQEVEQKSEWFCGLKFFIAPILKQSEKTVFEQKFAFSIVVFCSHAAFWHWFSVFFLQFKEFEFYWGADFFKGLFTHFHDFWSQIGVVILVTPKQEMERKSEWFCGVNCFFSNFKVNWENGVWKKIRFLAGGFLFLWGNFISIFTIFSIFWIGFFSKWIS